MKNIFEILNEIYTGGNEAVLCTVVNTKGSTPRKTGAKMIVYADGKLYGTIGGGDLERKVIENAGEIFRSRKPALFRHDLLHQHNMCCGGTVDVFLEPVLKKNKLYIFGAGHTGQSLANLAVGFDFEIFLIDDRKNYLDNCKTGVISKMNLPYEQALKVLPFDERTYVCIMTYSHPADRDILSACLNKSFAYLGMIGSRRKTEITKKMFEDGLNISREDLEKADMPMGIDIGAEGPEEIALSIMAKIIGVKNGVPEWKKELQS